MSSIIWEFYYKNYWAGRSITRDDAMVSIYVIEIKHQIIGHGQSGTQALVHAIKQLSNS